jgi:glutamate-ammonia-ligase adenylyltransferase
MDRGTRPEWIADSGAEAVAALSDLAQATLGLAVSHLLLEGHESGELALPDPANPQAGSGFVALGMGKLGAGELNYSSDIDLVLLHDPDSGVYRGDQPSGFFSRLSRNLVTLMEARDADGYVFRTDLRLRPDPAATPPCLRLEAALAYYESMGQNWERAAMLKARPVAGDLAMGHGFLYAIRPFIWRRHLDFAAVAEIHGRLMAARNRGAAVLLVSEDLDELLLLADRIVVMSEGRIVFDVPAHQADRRELGAFMGGKAPTAAPNPFF